LAPVQFQTVGTLLPTMDKPPLPPHLARRVWLACEDYSDKQRGPRTARERIADFRNVLIACELHEWVRDVDHIFAEAYFTGVSDRERLHRAYEAIQLYAASVRPPYIHAVRDLQGLKEDRRKITNERRCQEQVDINTWLDAGITEPNAVVRPGTWQQSGRETTSTDQDGT